MDVSAPTTKKSKPSSVRKRNQAAEKRFNCPMCTKKFSFSSNLHRHLKNIHRKVESCMVEGCNYQCSNKRKIMLHLELEHGPNVEMEDLQFPNLEEFYAWKLREEVQNFVCFTKRRGDTAMISSIHQHYICYLSRRSAAREKLEKLDLFCPARIIVKRSRDRGTVRVTYFKTHSHALTYSGSQHLPIPECVRHDIKEKLKAGLTISQVHSQLKRDHQSQLAVSIAMYHRLRKVEKAHIATIQKSLMKKGLLSSQPVEKACEERSAELAREVSNGEIVQDFAMEMEVETEKNFAKDLLLRTNLRPIASQTSRAPQIIEGEVIADVVEKDPKEKSQTTLKLQDKLKQLMTLLENQTVKKTMLPCVEGSVEELIVLCKAEQR